MRFRPCDRLWRLSLAVVVWPVFLAMGTAKADEPFPGPGPSRPYEPAPGVLAADPPGSAGGKSVALQVPPKPKEQPKTQPAAGAKTDEPFDPPYELKSIKDLKADMVPVEKIEAPGSLRMIHYDPAKIAQLDPEHFTSQPEMLTQLNGAYIEQRLSGPVSPFCFLPTYFEDDSLNRFGYSHGHLIQPVYSAAQFYVSVLMVPYQMQKRPCWDPVCPNYIPPPLTFKGKAEKFYREMTLESVAAEAAAVATVFLVFP